MIQQSKNAREAMHLAGFKRGEFSVRTPRNKYGEWGWAQIKLHWQLRGTDDPRFQALPNFGLGVEFIRDKTDGSVIVVSITQKHQKIKTFHI